MNGFKYIPIHAADDGYLYVMAWADLFVFNAESGDKIAEMRLSTTQDLQAIVMDEKRGSSWALACGRDHLYLSLLDGSVAVWDRATLRPIGVLTRHRGNIQRLAVDADYLYLGLADFSIEVFPKKDLLSV